MTGRPRFRAQATEHHQRSDGLGTVLNREVSEPRWPLPAAVTAAARLWMPQRAAKRRRVPVCIQTQISDCGPASLVMVLRYHGIEVDLDTVRTRANSGRNGASARSLLELGREFGLRGRGVRVGLAELASLAPGAILFWNFNHFVVLESATKDHVDVVDPAFGRRRLSREAVGESFTGVALEFVLPLADDPCTDAAPEGRPAAAHTDASRPWQRLRPFLPRGLELVQLAAVSAAIMAFELVLPLTTSHLVQRVTGDDTASPLLMATVGFTALAVLFLVLQLVRSLLVTWRQATIEKQLSWGVVEHLVTLPYDYFTVRNAGDLALRVRTGSQLNQVLGVAAVSAVADSLLIVCYLVAIVFADLYLALVVIGLIAAQCVLLGATWRQQVRSGQEVLERQTKTQDELVELLESIGTLKSTGFEAVAAERWSHTLVREVNGRLAARRKLSVTTSLSRTLQFVAPLAVLIIGVQRVAHGAGSLGAALGFMALTIALFGPLQSLFTVAAQLAMLKPTVARLDDVLRAVPEPRGALAGVGVVEPGQITVEDMSFRYPGAARPTLTDISFRVSPGEFVAVVGRSGSGKSTLGMVLAGLQTATSGRVEIDGISLSDLDRPTYRRQIAYINQDARLFGGSVKENITFGLDEIDRDHLLQAVSRAHVHEEIQAMPMAYNTLVGPSGHGLSGGQRQRIILARALAKKPRLLILDEATSALDPALEQKIFQGLLDAGITLIVIAHRLTVLSAADRVLVVSGGRIVETGTPADLSSRGEEFPCLL